MSNLPRANQDGLVVLAYSPWLYNVPWELYTCLMYIKEKYGNPTIILSENGLCQPFNKGWPILNYAGTYANGTKNDVFGSVGRKVRMTYANLSS
ncbi:hypothetical protein GOBAR_DD08199 [Gossypium barbadense]|nr:hypothetical protein GOBAR_DD08199 [Gossypium barbadense]